MSWQVDCGEACQLCKEHLKDKTCSECPNKPPETMGANLDVFDLWSYCNTQWIAGGFGVIGIDYNSVFKIAEILGIEIDENLLFKIKYIEGSMLKEINSESKKNG